ncbi:hypothetical protein PI125_g19615 [Phytophthora idaei]|nr:hypothetical protein PI125_g19615 [Phytophthora idaei]
MLCSLQRVWLSCRGSVKSLDAPQHRLKPLHDALPSLFSEAGGVR